MDNNECTKRLLCICLENSKGKKRDEERWSTRKMGTRFTSMCVLNRFLCSRPFHHNHSEHSFQLLSFYLDDAIWQPVSTLTVTLWYNIIVCKANELTAEQIEINDFTCKCSFSNSMHKQEPLIGEKHIHIPFGKCHECEGILFSIEKENNTYEIENSLNIIFPRKPCNFDLWE